MSFKILIVSEFYFKYLFIYFFESKIYTLDEIY